MINGKIIKVCGMRDAENIRNVEALHGVDMLGFIFYAKSPRYVRELPAYLPTHSQRVGVFVNEEQQVITMHAVRFGLDYVQLHGDESPEYCRELHASGLKIIKAFSIAQPQDLDKVSEYEAVCDVFLFDTKCEQYGGSGYPFDWNILSLYKGRVPFLLSGGINPESAHSLKEFEHPLLAGYDLNSRFERKPADKAPEQIQQFLNELESLIK